MKRRTVISNVIALILSMFLASIVLAECPPGKTEVTFTDGAGKVHTRCVAEEAIPGQEQASEASGGIEMCIDGDNDGYGEGTLCIDEDCNDNDATIYPGAPELCDEIDNQCPGDAGFGMVDEGCVPALDITVDAFSAHWPNQYYVELLANDPNHAADSVTVTGPGIDTPLALTYLNYMSTWWSIPNPFLGEVPPPPPVVYTFNIISNGTEYVLEATVEAFVHQFATNLSPSGYILGDIIFTWTGIGIPGAEYKIELQDSNWNRIWDSSRTEATSIAYAGPPLLLGTTYRYSVVASDTYGNASFATQEFVYGEAPPPPSPMVSVSPNQGPWGTDFELSGSDFTPFNIATLYFQSPDSSLFIRGRPTDEFGNFTYIFDTHPETPFGQYEYYAEDYATGIRSPSVFFTVTSPYVEVSPPSGPQGTIFNEAGFGFTPNSTVTLHFRSPDFSDYTVPETTDSSGNYTHTFQSDSGTAVGQWWYYADDDTTGAYSGWGSFNVTSP